MRIEISEAQLEELIFNSLKSEGFNELAEKGLNIYDYDFSYYECNNLPVPKVHFFKQPRLGGYGIADIISVQRECGKLNFTIIELKKDCIRPDSINQVFRYKKAIERYFESKSKSHLLGDIHCVLIGSSVYNCHYTLNNIEDLLVYTYDFGVDGLIFEHHYSAWMQTNEELNNFKF